MTYKLQPAQGSESYQAVADRLWQIVVDTYADNLTAGEDGVVVYQSRWEGELKASIVGALAGEHLICAGEEWDALRAENARLGQHIKALQIDLANLRAKEAE